MLLKELINKSVYGTIGYISSESDVEALESYLLYNLQWYDKRKTHHCRQ